METKKMLKNKDMQSVTCRKCGSVDIYTIYHRPHSTGFDWEYDSCGTETVEGVTLRHEHLFRHCRGCQYEWRDNTLERTNGDKADGK